MAQTKLRRLRGRAFRSLVEPFDIEFPENGCVLLRGHNLDTQGSSGAGKSNILTAIAYAFDYCPFPATRLQSWHTEEQMEIEVTFDTAEGMAVLTRGAVTSLVVAGGKAIKGANAVAQHLQRLVGLPPKIFSDLTYRPQRRPGLFLSRTDAEKKEFLVALLGLDRYEQESKKALERATAIQRELAPRQGAIQQARGELERVRAVLTSLGGLKSHADLPNRLKAAGQAVVYRGAEELVSIESSTRKQNEIDSLKERIETPYRPQIQQLQSAVSRFTATQIDYVADHTKLEALQQQLKGARQRIERLEEADSEKHLIQTKRYNELQQQIRSILSNQASIERLRTEVPGLEREIQQIESAICPTCGQQWLQGAAQIAVKRARIKSIGVQVEATERDVALLPPLNQEADALRGWEGNIDPKIKRFGAIATELVGQIAAEESTIRSARRTWEATQEAEHAKLREQLQTLLVRLSLEVEAAKRPLDDEYHRLSAASVAAHEAVWLAENAVRDLKLQISNIDRDNALHRAREAEVKAAEQRLGVLDDEIKRLTEEFAAEDDFGRAVGREGFLNGVFDETLLAIADEANDRLSRLPNVQHVTMQFRTDTQSKQGVIKNAIVPIFSLGGHESPIDSGGSGGMQVNVELAVDLAVAAVTSQRTGSLPGWLILDESFEGLERVNKEACMEMLSLFARDRLVLVVDHASEFKEMFTRFIDVELKDGRSRVLQ